MTYSVYRDIYKTYFDGKMWEGKHKQVQNPISDDRDFLWNSPSLGTNSTYRLP